MAVVYAHYNSGSGEIFYIGLGEKEKRAYSHKDRNQWWHNIVNKYGMEVEIIGEELSYEHAKEAEMFMIQFYGRADKKLGPLVNLTDGGDGQLGYKHTEEAKVKMSNRDLSYLFTSESIAKRIANTDYKDPDRIAKINTKEAHLKTIQNTDYKKKALNTNYAAMVANTDFAARTANTDYSFNRDPILIAKRRESMDYSKKAEKCWVPVLQYSLTDEFIKEWKSMKEVKEVLNIDVSHIPCVCQNKRKSSQGFIWKYKDKSYNKQDFIND